MLGQCQATTETAPNGREQSEGQSLVEVALVLPILLLLLAIVVDTARAFDAYIVLTNAVREGARYATLEPDPTREQIQHLVIDDVLGSGTNITHMADFSKANVEVIMGTSEITVTATYDFDLWFGGLVGVRTFELEKTAVMPMYLPSPAP
jgi:Flp pilus assembly protein TadG